MGPIERVRPVSVPEARFLRGVTDRRIKITVPGPFTLSSLAQDEHYGDPERLAMAYAAAVNAELRELEPIVDWVQLDEPYLQAHPDRGRAYGLAAIDRALAGLRKPTCIHLCFGYAYSHALAGSTKSGGYAFLPELERSAATQVSIEAAQPRLDLAVLESCPRRRSCWACSTSATPRRKRPTRSRGASRPRCGWSRRRGWWRRPIAG